MASKPRALVLDLFGDYLRYADAEVRLGPLTTLMAAFDVAPATLRVTLSRLRRESWFTTRREGRETVYALSPQMLQVLDEGRSRIFGAAPAAEADGWTMVIYQLSESERNDREQLRKDLAWHGFGPLTTSTWLAPGDRREAIAGPVAALGEDRVDVLRCLSDSLAQDRDLAARCWDLDALAAEYAAFVAANRRLLRSMTRMRGAKALVARTELVATYRHFPFKDPGLPAALRPRNWPGGRARSLFLDVHEGLGPAARAYVSEVVGVDIPEPVSRTNM